MSALLQLHLHSRLNTWLQQIAQRQLQDETRHILGFGASYIRDLTVYADHYANSSAVIRTTIMPRNPSVFVERLLGGLSPSEGRLSPSGTPSSWLQRSVEQVVPQVYISALSVQPSCAWGAVRKKQPRKNVQITPAAEINAISLLLAHPWIKMVVTLRTTHPTRSCWIKTFQI